MLYHCLDSHNHRIVMNAAARLVGGLCRFDHVTPVLRDALLWLPIQQRVVYKIAVFAFDCVRGTCPSYFRGVFTPLTEVSGRVGLCSAHRGDVYMCQPQGQNLATVVFAVLHRESETLCHFISVLLPSAENSSGLGSKPTSLSAPTQ